MSRARRGATAVEFALILPLFVMLMAVIMDGGWLFWQQSALDLAVHDGCRVGSLRDPGIGNEDIAVVRAAAAAAVETEMNARGVVCLDCDIDVQSVTTATEDALLCQVDWDWTPAVGLLPASPIRSTITMRLEMQR